MDPASVYLQAHGVPELVDRLVMKLVEDQPPNPKQFLRDQLHFMIEERFEGEEGGRSSGSSESAAPPFFTRQVPALNVRPVLAAKVVTAELYAKLGRLRSPQGVSLDDCISDGLSYHVQTNPVQATHTSSTTVNGSAASSAPSLALTADAPFGFLPGDADCYSMFSEVIDSLLALRCGGPLTGIGGRSFQAPKSELSASKITTGFQFQEKYVVGAAVKIHRNVNTFRLTPRTSRCERRALSKVLQRACSKAFRGASLTNGSYYPAVSLGSTPFAVDPLALDLRLPAAPSRREWCAGCNQEWPDARGSYISDDGVFFANVLSGEEHVEVATRAVRSSDVRDAFDRVAQGLTALAEALVQEDASYDWQQNSKYGYLYCDMDKLSCGGVTVTFVLKLPMLVRHELFPSVLQKLKLQSHQCPNVAKKMPVEADALVGVSNRPTERSYSATEADVVQHVCAAVGTLIELEEALLHQRSIEGKY